MKLSEVQVRQEIRAQIVKLLKEVRGSVEADVLMSSLARLPETLRSAFPGVGYGSCPKITTFNSSNVHKSKARKI